MTKRHAILPTATMNALETLDLCLKLDQQFRKAALMPLRFYARAVLVLTLAAPLLGSLTPSSASSLPADTTSERAQLRVMMTLRQSLLDTLTPENTARGQMLALNGFATAETVLSADIQSVRTALHAEADQQLLISRQAAAHQLLISRQAAAHQLLMSSQAAARRILALQQTTIEGPGVLTAPGIRPLIADRTTASVKAGAAPGAIVAEAGATDKPQPVTLAALSAVVSWAALPPLLPALQTASVPATPAASPTPTPSLVETGTITFTPRVAPALASGYVFLPNGARAVPLSIDAPAIVAVPTVHLLMRQTTLRPQAPVRHATPRPHVLVVVTSPLQTALLHRLHVLTLALTRIHALHDWAETTALPSTLAPAKSTITSPDDLAAHFDSWSASLPAETFATTATAPTTGTDASTPETKTIADALPPSALGGMVTLMSGGPLSAAASLSDSVPLSTALPLSDGVPLSTSTPLSDGVPLSTSTPLSDGVSLSAAAPLSDSLPALADAPLVVQGAVAPMAESPSTGTVTGTIAVDDASTMPVDQAVPFGQTPVTTTSILAASAVTTTAAVTPTATGATPDATGPTTSTIGVSMTVADGTARITTTTTLTNGAPFTLAVSLPAAVADRYAPPGFGSKRGALESVLRQGQALFARLKAGQAATDAVYQTQLRSVAAQNSAIESRWNGLISAYDAYQTNLTAYYRRKTAFNAYAHDLHVSQIQHTLWLERSAAWTRYAQLLHAYTLAVNAAASNTISATIVPPRPLQPVFPGPEPLPFTEVAPAWPGSPPAYVAYPGARPAGYALPTPPPAVPPWDGVTITTDVLAEARLVGTGTVNAALYANGREETTQSALLAAGALDGVGSYQDPIRGVISTYWGGSTVYQAFHPGLDIEGLLYTPIHATAAGVVVYAGYATPGARNDSYGLCIVIEHNAHISSVYAHMDDQVNGLHVRVGDIVQQGQVIGNIGMTGWTTGPHLHFELRQDNIQFDPLLLIPNPQD